MADIETFRGPVPRCRCCGKPLRPQYETEMESFREPATEWRKEFLGDMYPPNDPTVDIDCPENEGTPYNRRAGGWDARKKQWFTWERVYKVKRRKFLGTFGPAGNGFFCSATCGYRWAVNALSAERTERA